MDGGLDALFGGGAHHRAADITAAADDQIGPDLFQDSRRARAGQGQVVERYHVAAHVFRVGLRWKPLISIWWNGYPALVTRPYSMPSSAGKVDLGRGVRRL